MKPNGVHAAEQFLDLLDKDPELKDKVRKLPGVTGLGAQYNLKFTNEDLEKALQNKWGLPHNRGGGQTVDPYTCCCI